MKTSIRYFSSSLFSLSEYSSVKKSVKIKLKLNKIILSNDNISLQQTYI